MTELSVLIPARCEQFLARTIQDLLEHLEGDTEIIAVLDGAWADPPIADHPRVHLVYHSQSIGQRAATNEAARLSSARFVMKCDAHCAFDQGFDVKLMADCEADWTVIPRMYNLHVFDWQCKKCGNRTYQGPRPDKCAQCDNTVDFERVMVWQPRLSRKTDFARFDHELHFQYWGSYGKRPEAQGDIADVMCFVGACWMMRRERYWELDGCDEEHGSWGQQGVEMACKSWLSGGRVVVNKKTWFAHLFRTQPGFGFPYPNPGIEKARQYSRRLWSLDAPDRMVWSRAVRPLSWLIEKFAPVPDWDNKFGKERKQVIPVVMTAAAVESAPDERHASAQPGLAKGLVYYTDNQLECNPLAEVVRHQLARCCNGYEIVSASLLPLDFGRNIVVNRRRGILTMFKQILAGLEASTADIVFLVEHDVLYAKNHFDFVPPEHDAFYYNENTWKVRASDGLCLFYYTKQTSGLCAYRDLLVEHYRRRVAKVEQNAIDLRAMGKPVKNDGYSRHMGFEPGCHSVPRGVDSYPAKRWMSEFPNLDIRHDKNLTPNRWSQDLFRNPDACLGWTMADEVPGWGRIRGRFEEFLREVESGMPS